MDGYGAAYCEIFLSGHSGCWLSETEMIRLIREEIAMKKQTSLRANEILIEMINVLESPYLSLLVLVEDMGETLVSGV